MPYITPENRHRVRNGVPKTPGELNYKLTTDILNYLDLHGTSYTSLNAVIGVLTCIQHELYRRVISPYEDTKIEENGDVFPSSSNSR